MLKKAFFFLLLTSLLYLPFSIFAASLDEQSDKVQELQEELNKITKTKNTLANQIKLVDSQVALTTLKISQTTESITLLEKQVAALAARVEELDKFLNRLSLLFLAQVEENYKFSRQNALLSLLSSKNFNSFLQRYQYQRVLQLESRQLLLDIEEARLNYDLQKQEKEKKQKELEQLKATLSAQNIELAQQKQSKETLLAVTKNDEKTYQQLLASAMAEYQAMQAIISNRGDETEVGSVAKGEKIANIISGASTCSTGTHLHFEVLNGGSRLDPAQVLSSQSVEWDNQPDPPFSFNGSWDWPIRGHLRVTQGYGMTYFARVYKYYGGNPHSGIDIVSNDDSSAYSVSDGTLYNGSIPCGGGRLRYVKVDHKDSDYVTYYLHINYTRG